MKKLLLALCFLAFSPLSSAVSSGLDLHAYWDQRCKDCHGHSSEFARRSLRVEEGRLVAVRHRDDREVVLRNHCLGNGLQEPVIAMLTAQLSTPPLLVRSVGSLSGPISQRPAATNRMRDCARLTK